MKTEHYCTSDDDNNFGGYLVNPNFNDNNLDCQKEKSHAIGYSNVQDVSPVTLGFDKWIGFKGICYSLPDGTVKLEGWVDNAGGVGGGTWTKITEAIDDGTWGGTGGGTPIQTGAYTGSALRTDLNAVDGFVEYKFWSIREITPPVT